MDSRLKKRNQSVGSAGMFKVPPPPSISRIPCTPLPNQGNDFEATPKTMTSSKSRPSSSGSSFETPVAASGLSRRFSEIGSAIQPSRVSVLAKGGSSIVPQSHSILSSVKKPGEDPRPLKDKNYQADCIQTIYAFLEDRGFDNSLNPSMLQLPSGKLFIKIFEFVMKQMDTKFKYGNKPEDDILEVMKGLHYPYNISRSSLQQAGTPHTWPPLLSMLNWLVQTLNFLDATSDPGAIPAQPASSTARGFESSLTNPTLETLLDEEHCRAVFFEFMKEGYYVFMNAETEELSDTRIEHLMQQFLAYFEGARQEVESNVQNLREELLRKEATLKSKQDRSELEKLLEDKVTLEKQQGELVNATERGKMDLQTFEEILLDKQQELKSCTETTISIQANNALLQKRIEEQKFSKEDIERMAERLAGRNAVLKALKENRMQVEKEACKAEVQKVKTMEELEQAANTFNETATRLKLIPPSSKHAQGRCFSIRVNPHATNARDILSDSMSKADIRAAIQEVAQRYSSKEQRLYAELATLDIQLAEESEEVAKIAAELEMKEDVKKRVITVGSPIPESDMCTLLQEEEEMLQASQRARQEVQARLEDIKRRELRASVEIENRAACLETLRQESQDRGMQLEQQSQAEFQAMEEMKETAVRLESILENHMSLVCKVADSVALHAQKCLDALEELPE